MLLAHMQVGDDFFAVDIDTQDFTWALRRLFEHEKQDEEQQVGVAVEGLDPQEEEAGGEKTESADDTREGAAGGEG